MPFCQMYISLLDLEKDLDSLNNINTTQFIMDTAHQKDDLIHRFDAFNITLKIRKCLE